MTTIHTDTPSLPTSSGNSGTLNRAAEKISELGERAGDVARQGARHLDDSAQQVKGRLNAASSSALAYVKDEPVRAVLIAAGIGAALMALTHLLGRSRY
jgi:ElaB/YqjD/DUF883 family membrane-anchored ribosome-binding protein